MPGKEASMTKNRIRGKPKKKTNRVRDSDILKKINKDKIGRAHV